MTTRKTKKAKKKIGPKHRFMPRDTNPRWLKGFTGDWTDVHDQLLQNMTELSDYAVEYKRNLYAHLNAARYVAIQQCVRISMRKTNSKMDAVHQMEALLHDILFEVCWFEDNSVSSEA